MTRHRGPVAALTVAVVLTALLAVLLPTTPGAAQTTSTTRATAAGSPVGSSCPARPTALHNSGFEGPFVADGTSAVIETTTVQGWSSGQKRVTFAATGFEGITAATGRQFLELVDTSSTAVHQDLITSPGETLVWAFMHRAVSSAGTVRVRIGAPGEEGATQGSFTDGEAWTPHSGTYTVPADQTISRITFEADRGAPTGNLIDDASFGSAACLLATTSVVPTGTVDVGTALTESVVVRNVGGAPTSGAELTTTLPPTMAYRPGSERPAGVWNPDTATLTVALVGGAKVPGVVLPGEAITVSWQVDVKPEAADSVIRSDVTLSASDALGGPRRTASNTAATAVRPSADVKLTQSFSPALVAPGASTTLTFSARNEGPSSATGVTVAATLPDGATVVAGSTPAGCRLVAPTLSCTVGTMANGDERTWSVDLVAPGTTGIVHSTIVANSTTPDPSFVNGATSEALSVGPPVGPQLDVRINRSPVVATAGSITTLVADITNVGSTPISSPITVANLTPEPFVDLFLAATPPAGSPPADCRTDAHGCTLASLAPGQSARVEFRGTVRPETDDGTSFIGSVAASAAGVATTTASAAISVRAVADLTLTQTSPTTPDVAVPVTSIITVTNAGPSFAKSTSVFIPLAERAVVVARPSGCTEGYGGLLCPLGDVLPGRPAATAIAFSLPRTGAVVTDRAYAVTSTPTIGPVTDLTPERWVAEPAVNLSVALDGVPDQATTGEVFELVVTAVNTGPGDAHDVIVALDPTRNGLRVVGDESASGDFDTATSRWTVATLPANARITLRLTVEVGRAGRPSLAASIAATEPDVDSAGTTAISSLRTEGPAVDPDTGGSSSPLPWIVLGVVVLAAAATTTIVVRRRRNGRTA